MHRLVFDQAFQQRRRRVPRQSLQPEQRDVEPAFEDLLQIALQSGQRPAPAPVRQELLPHLDQEPETTVDPGEATEQMHPSWFQRLPEHGLRSPSVGSRLGGGHRGDGPIDRIGIVVVGVGQPLEEPQPAGVGQRGVGGGHGPGPASGCDLAAPGGDGLVDQAGQVTPIAVGEFGVDGDGVTRGATSPSAYASKHATEPVVHRHDAEQGSTVIARSLCSWGRSPGVVGGGPNGRGQSPLTSVPR